MARTRAGPRAVPAMRSTALPLAPLSLSPRQTLAVPSDAVHGHARRMGRSPDAKAPGQGGFLRGAHPRGRRKWLHPHLLSCRGHGHGHGHSALCCHNNGTGVGGHTLACPAENLLPPVGPPSAGTRLSSCLCNPVFFFFFLRKKSSPYYHILSAVYLLSPASIFVM